MMAFGSKLFSLVRRRPGMSYPTPSQAYIKFKASLSSTLQLWRENCVFEASSLQVLLLHSFEETIF